MWSLFPRKLRLFFSKLVGKLSRKCKNSSPAGIRRKDRNRPRIKAFDPEDDLRRTALKNSFVNKLTGLSFNKPGSLKQLGEKIKIFHVNRKLINKMGLEANKLVTKNFKISTNLNKLEGIYNNQINYFDPASLK